MQFLIDMELDQLVVVASGTRSYRVSQIQWCLMPYIYLEISVIIILSGT